jgi:hypothetical protein
MIPFVAVISLRNQESRTFRLWIPLVLLWVLLLPLGALLSPFIFIACLDSEDDGGHDGPTKVNVRVPMQLLRAGVKLASLLNAQIDAPGDLIEPGQLEINARAGHCIRFF